MSPAETLRTIRARLRRLVDCGALTAVRAEVLYARAHEAGQEALRSMMPRGEA